MTKSNRITSAMAAQDAAEQIRAFTRAPKKPSPCACKNHLGGPKQQFKDRDTALKALIRNHLWTGKGYVVYPCPTSARFHVGTKR